jgi:hypothetical protein
MVQKKRKTVIEKQAAAASPSKRNNRRLKSEINVVRGLDIPAMSSKRLV